MEHILDCTKTLVHITATGELHRHPVRLDLVSLDEVDKGGDIYGADFNYFTQDEPLLVVRKRSIHGERLSLTRAKTIYGGEGERRQGICQQSCEQVI